MYIYCIHFFHYAFWISLSLVVYRWDALHLWKLCVSNAFAAFPVSTRFPVSDHGFFEQAKSNKPGVLLSKLGLVIPTARCFSWGNSYVIGLQMFTVYWFILVPLLHPPLRVAPCSFTLVWLVLKETSIRIKCTHVACWRQSKTDGLLIGSIIPDVCHS